MQDLTEITLLDFIFSQQDRIGNIDYLEHWYWVEGGQVHHRLSHSGKVPADIAPFHPRRIRRTLLNDNDAAGRLPYANYAKRTGMLEKIRHYNPESYRRLMALDADFGKKGELYQYLQKTFGLSPRQLKMVVNNTREATRILQGTCKRGELRFELDLEEYLLKGDVRERKIPCSG